MNLDERRRKAVEKRIADIEREADYMAKQAAAKRSQAAVLRRTWGIEAPCACKGDCIMEHSSHPDEMRMCPEYTGISRRSQGITPEGQSADTIVVAKPYPAGSGPECRICGWPESHHDDPGDDEHAFDPDPSEL